MNLQKKVQLFGISEQFILLLFEKRPPTAAELDFEEFASLSFTHHNG